jgi:hypothetical protein
VDHRTVRPPPPTAVTRSRHYRALTGLSPLGRGNQPPPPQGGQATKTLVAEHNVLSCR